MGKGCRTKGDTKSFWGWCFLPAWPAASPQCVNKLREVNTSQLLGQSREQQQITGESEYKERKGARPGR